MSCLTPHSRAVPGLGKAVAAAIVASRDATGPFTSRADVARRKIKGIGPKTFEQISGFLRVPESHEALDNTPVHPESYDAAKKLVCALRNIKTGERERGKEKSESESERGGDTWTWLSRDVSALRPLLESVAREGDARERREVKREHEADAPVVDCTDMAASLGVGMMTLRHLAASLLTPGREDVSTPAHLVHDTSSAPTSLAALKTGDVLSGVVRNVVAFGAFIDVGVETSGLMHVSRARHAMEKNDVSGRHPMSLTPHDFFHVGQTLRVQVVHADVDRKRLALGLYIPPPKEERD